LDNGLEQLEGRNPVIEALLRKRRKVRRVLLDERAREDDKVRRLTSLCEQAGVRIERVNRDQLDRMAAGEVHNGVIAHADPLPDLTVQQLLDQVYARGEMPFLVLADEISYEHNLGAILRSALGAGVHGVVVPTKRGKGLSPVVHRVSMGGAEAVPLVREGLSSALKICHKAGLRIVGADMGGVAHWDLDWTIPTALVLGGESKGLSSTLRKRCDAIVGVPLQGELESLNVSVTAGIMLFERARQLSLQG
jgi:23S rRNA (guanosine2251-2'-O)-methyltransferase